MRSAGVGGHPSLQPGWKATRKHEQKRLNAKGEIVPASGAVAARFWWFLKRHCQYLERHDEL